jgi:hypothetical protein
MSILQCQMVQQKTSNFSEKTRNERRYSRLQDGPLSRSRYTVTISDLSLYMKQVQ